jgi:hypothetical protein
VTGLEGTGATGLTGVTGLQGQTGVTGSTGLTGVTGTAGVLNDLGDVVAPTPVEGDFLYNDGTNWINSTPSDAGFYGSDASYAISDGVSATTSITFINKTQLITDSMPSGIYRVGYCAEIQHESTSQDTHVRLTIDGTTVNEVNDRLSSAVSWASVGGFAYFDAEADATHEINVDFHSSSTGKIAYIRRGRVEIWRDKDSTSI